MSKIIDSAKIGAGHVEITLNGETKYLKPTFRAAQNLSREFNGLSSIVSRIIQLEISTIASVIANGLSLTDDGKKGLEEKIYMSGVGDLASPCIRYISHLTNGGQPAKKVGEGEDSPTEGED